MESGCTQFHKFLPSEKFIIVQITRQNPKLVFEKRVQERFSDKQYAAIRISSHSNRIINKYFLINVQQ